MTTWQHGDQTFIYRVAAVIMDHNRVLLHPTPSRATWSLPEEDVGFLEGAADALKRAVRQETGLEVAVERLLWVAESFYAHQERRYHVLGLYFLASLPASLSDQPPQGFPEGPLEKERGQSSAGWFACEARHLADLTLDPPFLRQALLHLPDQTVYLTDIH